MFVAKAKQGMWQDKAVQDRITQHNTAILWTTHNTTQHNATSYVVNIYNVTSSVVDKPAIHRTKNTIHVCRQVYRARTRLF